MHEQTFKGSKLAPCMDNTQIRIAHHQSHDKFNQQNFRSMINLREKQTKTELNGID